MARTYFELTSIRILCGGLVVLIFLGLAVSLAAVTKNKPYGVPDHRLAEYDRKLQQFKETSHRVHAAYKSSAAKAFVPETKHDFGFLDPGTNGARHDFRISNQGQADLVLTPSGGSCKCTLAEIKDRIIPPGESRKVTVVWNVGSDVSDFFEETAIIETNDPLHELIELTIRGRIRTRWGYQSKGLTRLKGSSDLPIDAELVVYSQLYDDFVILGTETSAENIDVSVEPINIVKQALYDAKCGYRVRLKSLPLSRHSHSFDATVRINVFDLESEASEWIEVPFSGKFGSPLVFHGPDLDVSGYDLGTVEVGEEKRWPLFVRFRTIEPIAEARVKAIEPPCLTAKIEPIEKLKNTFRVTITLSENAEPSRFRFDRQGYIQIEASDNPSLSDWMPLFGEVIDKPR